jgi:hypothetical protein
MTRLPEIDGDQGVWGSILNTFLLVSHNPDGTLQPSAVAATGALQSSATIPTSDLSGTYENPTVAKIQGITISGTPSSGQALIASSTTAAAWTTLPSTIPSNGQSSAYVLVLTDAGDSIDVTSATATTVTVPPNSSVAFPIGTVLEVSQLGTGQITIVAGAGVTLNSPGSLVHTRVQYSVLSLRKLTTNTWILSGDLA